MKKIKMKTPKPGKVPSLAKIKSLSAEIKKAAKPAKDDGKTYSADDDKPQVDQRKHDRAILEALRLEMDTLELATKNAEIIILARTVRRFFELVLGGVK